MLAWQMKEKIQRRGNSGRSNLLTSSDLGACSRLGWYRRNKSSEMLSVVVEDRLMLMDGVYGRKAMLTMLQEVLGVHASYNDYPATAVLGDVAISCRIAALILVPGHEKQFVLQFQRTSSRQFEQFDNEGIRAFPQWEERCLLHILAAQQSLHLDNPPDSAILLVQDRETSDLAEEVIRFDEGRLEELSGYIDTLESVMQDPSPPDRPFKQGDIHCRNCVARLECWGPAEDNKIALEHMDKDDRLTALRVAGYHEESKTDRDSAQSMLDDNRQVLTDLLDKYKASRLEIVAQNGYRLTASYQSSSRTVIDEDTLRELAPDLANRVLSKSVSKFVRVDGRASRTNKGD